MLEILRNVEAEIMSLLVQPDVWTSLNINYHRPYVERLWTTMSVDGADKPVRVNLHRIHPCQKEDALFHPHPWPSAMRILRGQYEMGFGVQHGTEQPFISTTVIGQRGMVYEMPDPNAWHYVRPRGMANVLSLMVTGELYPEEIRRSNPSPPKVKLGELTEEQRTSILALFKAFYNPRVKGYTGQSAQ